MKRIYACLLMLVTINQVFAESDEKALAKRFNIPQDKILVWESSRAQYQGRFSVQQAKIILDTLNFLVGKQVDGTTEFTPPRKDDYEKTSDYEARVKKAKAEFDNSLAVKDPVQYRFTGIKEAFTAIVGRPVYPRSYSKGDYIYNADTEMLTLNIRSFDTTKSEVFAIPASFPLSPAQARLLDEDDVLECIPPRIIMEWSPPKLVAKYMVPDIESAEEYCSSPSKLAGLKRLLTGLPANHVLKKGIPLNYTLPASFEKITDQEYKVKLNKGKEADAQKREAEMKNKRWYPLFSRIRDQIAECVVVKNNVLTLDMTSGEQRAYESIVATQKRYPLCFR